ncbi:hypothetical protein HF846_04125 [Clostridium cadaveris]|uniref:Uncharacterized protein n=1 Tax=Clostridium cadaveris TaxID=1529 RepID=A0A316M3H2_9CLOT|nr:Lar family restriction alleviation protein [Clostridium cadaveris]MDU4953775.1 Lar family restriction alleviation protein [Clostridium sp.]NME63787.1 hypothetical protein [Clostridium cadaveris]PWL51779.1 MAG: hypothetical protein DBY38_12600 [Clostridium cadaveris]
MKKIFERLSGKPKNGDIIECMRPYIAIPQTIIAIIIMIHAIKTVNIVAGLTSLLLTWQVGWGMSIERFIQSEKQEEDNFNENNVEEDEIDPLDVLLPSPVYEETITTTISNDDISKLKPCPKCGGEGELNIGYDTEKVVCKQCGAKTHTFVGDYYDEGFMDGEVATAWWNRGEVIESKNEV